MRYIGLISLLLSLCSGQTMAYSRQDTPIRKEATPVHPTSRPIAELSSVRIQLESHGRRSGDGPYTLVIAGDGTVVFTPSQFDSGWILGPQTYHIAPEHVVAMLDAAEMARFWSLDDVYRPASLPEDQRDPGISALTEDGYRQVEIKVGDTVKDLRVYDWGNSGVSENAYKLFYKIGDLARLQLWHRFSHETIEQLVANGFDFHSENGGELLIEMVENSHNPDADIESLLTLGAPAEHVNLNGYLLETSLLDAAIDSGRSAFVDKLIAKSALLTAGQADALKSTRALAHAVGLASITMTAKLLLHHPPLILHRTGQIDAPLYGKDIPVITLVGSNRGLSPFEQAQDPTHLHDVTTVAQELLDVGADINSRDSHGNSLLSKAANDGDVEFARWLLTKGASLDKTLVANCRNENAILLLLKAGAHADDDTFGFLVNATKANAWTNVRVWLKARGKWPAG